MSSPNSKKTKTGVDVDTDTEHEDEHPSPAKPGCSSNLSTPITIPQKRKLEFDFWATTGNSAETTVERTQVLITDLAAGNYSSNFLNFRVAHVNELRITQAGSFFKFTGMDSTGEIEFTAFREVADKYHQLIKLNGIFCITSFSVKVESSAYPSWTGIPFTINCTPESEIVELFDENLLPKIQFKFTSLYQFAHLEPKSKIDILGIVVKDWQLQTTSKMTKRDITLTDSTKASVMVTLWGSAAENFSSNMFECIAIRRGSVTEFLQKRSVNCGFDCSIFIDPNLEQATALRKWFEEEQKKRP